MQNEEDYPKLIQVYRLRIKLLEERLTSEIEARDRQIEIYKEHINYLQHLLLTISARHIVYNNNLEARAMADQSKSEARNVNFNAPIQGAGYVEGNSHFYAASEQKQSLAEAASEIQNLLKRLEKTNPSATEAEKVAYVNDETALSFKRRVVGALQSAGEAAIEEFLDNPYINVGKAIVKGWIKPE